MNANGLLILIVLALVAACPAFAADDDRAPSSRYEPPVPDELAPSRGGGSVLPSHYRIEPPDVLSIEMTTNSGTAGARPVKGQCLVGPGGTINLRQYGIVHVAGKTAAEAQAAIRIQLKAFPNPPQISVEMAGYNSKFYYSIQHRTGRDIEVRRMPITGYDTVVDAASKLRDVSQLSTKKIWIVRQDPNNPGCHKVLRIDWKAIAEGATIAENYEILPGDWFFAVDKDYEAPWEQQGNGQTFHQSVDKARNGL